MIPLYIYGHSPRPVIIILSGALAIISAADTLRLRNASFERFYEGVLGHLMRESEKARHVDTPMTGCLMLFLA